MKEWTILAAQLEPEVRLRPPKRPAPAMAGEEEEAWLFAHRLPMASTRQKAARLRISVNVQARAVQAHMAALHRALAARRGMERAQVRDVEILEKLIEVGQGCRSICCTSKSVEQPGCRSLSHA